MSLCRTYPVANDIIVHNKSDHTFAFHEPFDVQKSTSVSSTCFSASDQVNHMSTNTLALSLEPQTPVSTRSNEEGLTALLIIAILAVGGLISVAKGVGNRLLGSRDTGDQHRGESDVKPKMSKTSRNLKSARAGTNAVKIDYPYLSDRIANGKSQNLQLKIPNPQLHLSTSLHDRIGDYAAGLNAIRAWEESTVNRIKRQKSRKLDSLLSLDDNNPHSTGTGKKPQDVCTVLAWEQATMQRFQQEKTRRLQRLSTIEPQEVSQEEKVGKTDRF